MNKPIDHRPGEDPVVDALRASLHEHARQTPAADGLAERIIASVDIRPPARDVHRTPRRGWRTWTLPLVAAGSVAAVVGGAIAIEQVSSESDKAAPAGSPTAVHSAPATGRPSVATSAPTQVRSTPTSVDTSLHGVKVLDLTFAGLDDGWALASADCIRGAGKCTALLRTTDGTTWKSMPGAAFNVAGVKGCADPCVEHLRFANDQVGYAFGPSAFFMTTDGGRRWTAETGGAEALETLNGNVIRVVSDGSGCPGPCAVQAEFSSIGSPSWKPVPLGRPTGSANYGISFARGGSDAYLLFSGHTAGGAGNATSTLYRSTDNGVGWFPRGEPCPQSGGEIDSTAIAAAPGGRVSVLCATRQAPLRYSVATSSDHGATFTAQPGVIPAATADTLTGDPATVLVAAGTGLSRSTDGGRSWAAVPDVTGRISFVGFESDRVARAVADDGRTIWTTRDGGASWTKAGLG
jgi:photosystem II stability/assembly factor-like uncharacterized protein